MFNAALLAAVIQLSLGTGKPAAVIPVDLDKPPVPIWYDSKCLHVGEDSVPWGRLKVDAPKNGTTFWYEFPYCLNDGSKVFIDGTLRDDASSFVFDPFTPTGRFADEWIEGKLTVTAAKEGKFGVFFFTRGRRPKEANLFADRHLKAGETVQFPISGYTADRSQLQLILTDTTREKLIKAVLPFRKKLPVFCRVIKTDIENERLLLETDNDLGPQDDYSVRLRISDMKDVKNVVYDKTMPVVRCRAITNEVFDIRSLPPGYWRVDYSFAGSDGKIFGEGYDYYAKEDGIPPWDKEQSGDFDIVPPPWTEPVATDGAFLCWGRKYEFGGKALVESIRSHGRELLSRPVILKINERPLKFTSRCVSRCKQGAKWELSSQNSQFPVVVHVTAEFDGFAWFDIEWGGGNGKVCSFELEIPLARKYVQSVGAYPTGGSHILKPGEMSSWNEDPTTRPYFWIGDCETGLMGGVDSLRGWHTKDLKKGYAMSASQEEVLAVMRFVDEAFVPAGKRRISFYLEATPTKPKNLAQTMIPRKDIVLWTGHVERFFDTKLDGFMQEDRCRGFVNMIDRGMRVFWYSSSDGVGALSPWWGRFGSLWSEDPADWRDERYVRSKDAETERRERENGCWSTGCINEKSFRDFRVWSNEWFINDPRYKVKDLYFDLATPGRCKNPRHDCVWKDEFGRTMNDFKTRSLRDLHKRIYIALKRKNPDGAFAGHSMSRCPSDVYFDRVVCGEQYCGLVAQRDSYYDVLTPEDMQTQCASLSNEAVVDILPQIVRAYQILAPYKLKTFDPNAPEMDRAIRHATAYFKIHDLLIASSVDGRHDGPQWQIPESTIRDFGEGRTFSSYYHADCPVSVSNPDSRFLYAIYQGKGRALLVLLNDTKAAKTETISIRNFSSKGKDLFGRGDFDFSNGSCVVTLPSRESLFILFE